MVRFEQRKQDFYSALDRLKEAISENPTDIIVDGTLHRFEFTFELAWKTVKDYLEFLGIVNSVGSPREIIKSGYKQGIIEDGDGWIAMMLARNSLSHMYDEITSRMIYDDIVNRYIGLFDCIKTKFEQI